MALRRFMHPRNKYREGADFRKMAMLYPVFRQHTTVDLTGKLRYNFKSEESLRILAKTLLKHDFQLDVEIPEEKLVPAMPLRLNYILWIEDLLKYGKLLVRGEEIHGIDVGTGAVCIYPLLCAKTYGWRMTGTEISDASVISANRNVVKNHLDSLIKVIRIENEKSPLASATEDTVAYSFSMCNPPFFAEDTKKKDKRLPPRNAATGNTSELVVEGGERQFVTRLIDESASLGSRVKIYTTMLGLKSSCAFFRAELKKRNILNATWTEFCQGHTKRWGLAWSFLPKELIDLTNAPIIRTRLLDSSPIKQPKDRPSETVFPLAEKFPTFDVLIALLKQWLNDLKIEIKELDAADTEFDGWTCRLKAYEDSWSHARRKRRMARQQEKSPKQPRLENPESEKSDDCTDSSSVSCSVVGGSDKPAEPVLLECSLALGQLETEEGGNLVKMSMIFESGRGGKHALETFRQYLINKFNIREYLLSRSRSLKSSRSKKRRGKKSGGSGRSTELNVLANE